MSHTLSHTRACAASALKTPLSQLPEEVAPTDQRCISTPFLMVPGGASMVPAARSSLRRHPPTGDLPSYQAQPGLFSAASPNSWLRVNAPPGSRPPVGASASDPGLPAGQSKAGPISRAHIEEQGKDFLRSRADVQQQCRICDVKHRKKMSAAEMGGNQWFSMSLRM